MDKTDKIRQRQINEIKTNQVKMERASQHQGHRRQGNGGRHGHPAPAPHQLRREEARMQKGQQEKQKGRQQVGT